MHYKKRIVLEIIPDSSPDILRNCSKCGEKSNFSNTGKFRVNANGNCIDVWLIYACSQCKTTYNLTIYDRIAPSKLSKEEYLKFSANETNLAMHYGWNNQILQRNKAETDLENITYQVHEKLLEMQENPQNMDYREGDRQATLIKINCHYPLKIRVDRFLSEYLHYSRTRIKQFMDDQKIRQVDCNSNRKKYITDGMEFYFLI